QGTLFDPAALAVALAQQDGRRRVAIGNRFDIHRNMITVKTGQTSLKYHITWLQFGAWRTKKLAISIVSLHGKQEVPSRVCTHSPDACFRAPLPLSARLRGEREGPTPKGVGG